MLNNIGWIIPLYTSILPHVYLYYLFQNFSSNRFCSLPGYDHVYFISLIWHTKVLNNSLLNILNFINTLWNDAFYLATAEDEYIKHIQNVEKPR